MIQIGDLRVFVQYAVLRENTSVAIRWLSSTSTIQIPCTVSHHSACSQGWYEGGSCDLWQLSTIPRQLSTIPRTRALGWGCGSTPSDYNSEPL